MKAIIFLTIALSLLLTAKGEGQTGTKLEWTQDAPSLSVAIGYRYNLGVNGVWQNSLLFASCTGSVSPYKCTATIPANIAPGTHKLTIRTVDVTSVIGPVASESSAETDYIKPPPAKPNGLVVKA